MYRSATEVVKKHARTSYHSCSFNFSLEEMHGISPLSPSCGHCMGITNIAISVQEGLVSFIRCHSNLGSGGNAE